MRRSRHDLLLRFGDPPMKNKQKQDLLLEITSWKDMLRFKPIANSAMKVERSEDGLIIAEVHITPSKWLLPPLSWFIRPRTSKKVALDRIGSEIFNLCNGKRRFEHIVDKFAENHRLTFHESRTAVGDYIKSLTQRGILVVVSPT